MLDENTQNTTSFPANDNYIPPIIEVALLFFTIVFFFFIGQGLTYAYGQLSGVEISETLQQVHAGTYTGSRNFFRVIALISTSFTFVFPALFFSVFLYKKNWSKKLYLQKAPYGQWLLMTVVFMLAGFFLSQFTFWINKQIPLPDWANDMEENTGNLINTFLVMDNVGEFLFTLFVVAVAPAIGEELIFRGILQKKLEENLSNPHLAILIASLIFSFIHFQFQGFLPRVVLGLLLGYLFYWTKNLWVPIFAHFFINGIQVVASYFMQDQLGQLKNASMEDIDVSNMLLSTVFSLLVVYTISRWFQNEKANRTNLLL